MVWVAVSVPGAISGSATGATGAARTPSPLVGEGWGGGDCRTSPGGSPPTPGASPRGGGEPAEPLATDGALPPSSSAIGVFTLTPSVPSGTSSLETLPSST